MTEQGHPLHLVGRIGYLRAEKSSPAKHPACRFKEERVIYQRAGRRLIQDCSGGGGNKGPYISQWTSVAVILNSALSDTRSYTQSKNAAQKVGLLLVRVMSYEFYEQTLMTWPEHPPHINFLATPNT